RRIDVECFGILLQVPELSDIADRRSHIGELEFQCACSRAGSRSDMGADSRIALQSLRRLRKRDAGRWLARHRPDGSHGRTYGLDGCQTVPNPDIQLHSAHCGGQRDLGGAIPWPFMVLHEGLQQRTRSGDVGDYTPYPAVDEFGMSVAGYAGFDPATAPNGGQGFDKDLSGNKLPNAPPFTLSGGA